jgi:hypothetical protein
MTYSTDGLIQASDFNTFATSLNTLWAIGTGDKGLGQTRIEPVAAGGKVTAAQWDAIIDVSNTLASKQGPDSELTQPDNYPAKGNQGSTVLATDAEAVIAYMSVISSNITTLTTNRLNGSGQTSQTPVPITSTQRWTTQAIFSYAISFTNGDAARFFFNGGGQLVLTMSHPTGTQMDSMFALLASQIGTLTISSAANSPSTVKIAGTEFTGFQQDTIVPGAAPEVYQTNAGYYGLTTQSTEIFKQRMSTGFYSDYLGSSISVYAKTNGTQGANGDNGNVITIDIVWSEVPPSVYVSAGSSMALQIKQPALTYLTKSWGNPSVQIGSSFA